jgi:hypothetical protein
MMDAGTDASHVDASSVDVFTSDAGTMDASAPRDSSSVTGDTASGDAAPPYRLSGDGCACNANVGGNTHGDRFAAIALVALLGLCRTRRRRP